MYMIYYNNILYIANFASVNKQNIRWTTIHIAYESIRVKAQGIP